MRGSIPKPPVPSSSRMRGFIPLPCPAKGMDSCLRRNDGEERGNDGKERVNPPPCPSPTPSSSRMRGSIPLPCQAKGMDSCLRRNDGEECRNDGKESRNEGKERGDPSLELTPAKSGKAAAMSCRCLAALPNSAQRVAGGLALGSVFVVGRSAHGLQAAVGRVVQAQAVCGVFQQALQDGLTCHGRVGVSPFI